MNSSDSITNASIIEASVSATENFSQSGQEEHDPSDPYPGIKPQFKINWGGNTSNSKNWNDWKWQLKNSIKSFKDLKRIFNENNIPIPDGIEETAETFPLTITPYYLSLIKAFDYSDPVFSMSIPNKKELNNPSYLSNDPLHEEEDTVIDGLVHRYADRALLISTSKCSMNCRFSLSKGTKITMSDFSEKAIEDICIGDDIITHKGLVKKVYDVFNREYKKDILNIKAQGNINIRTTQEHPFLVIKRKDILCNDGGKSICKPNRKSCKKRHKNKITSFTPNFIDASEIKEGDYLATPRFKNKTEKYTDENLGYLMGIYLAEGDLPKRRNGNIIGSRFSLGFHEKETIALKIKKCSESLKLRLCTIHSYEKRSSCNVMIFDEEFSKFLQINCGQYSDLKKISEEIMYNSSNLFKRAMLEGMLEGDGWMRDPSLSKRNLHSIEFNTVSNILANQIFMLLNHLGFCPKKYITIEKNKEKRIGKQILTNFKPINRVRVSNQEGFENWNNKKEDHYESSSAESFYTEEYVFNKVEKITMSPPVPTEKFYDLSIEDDESYLAEFMSVHNCTRKRVTGENSYVISDLQLKNIVNYLSDHPEIKDVIISGGDPFTMSTDKLEKIISKVRSVKSVEIIRIGTRTPVVMPQRITNDLIDMINKYHPIFVNTHFNHPNEITEESKKACLKLIENGIPVNNQNVLLKGINDNPKVMEELCRSLLKIRTRCYYMFQCDLVKGIEHFRTPIERGIEIMEHLRGRVSGLGIPQFIVDSPEGNGKIPLLPNYTVGKEGDMNILRNYKDELVFYPDP